MTPDELTEIGATKDTFALCTEVRRLQSALAIVEAERDTFRSVVENLVEWLDGHATTEEIRAVLAEHRRGWKP